MFVSSLTHTIVHLFFAPQNHKGGSLRFINASVMNVKYLKKKKFTHTQVSTPLFLSLSPRKNHYCSISILLPPPTNFYHCVSCLDQQLLNLELHPINCAFQLRSLIGCDGTSNHRTRNPTSSTKSNFAAKTS